MLYAPIPAGEGTVIRGTPTTGDCLSLWVPGQVAGDTRGKHASHELATQEHVRNCTSLTVVRCWACGTAAHAAPTSHPTHPSTSANNPPPYEANDRTKISTMGPGSSDHSCCGIHYAPVISRTDRIQAQRDQEPLRNAKGTAPCLAALSGVAHFQVKLTGLC